MSSGLRAVYVCTAFSGALAGHPRLTVSCWELLLPRSVSCNLCLNALVIHHSLLSNRCQERVLPQRRANPAACIDLYPTAHDKETQGIIIFVVQPTVFSNSATTMAREWFGCAHHPSGRRCSLTGHGCCAQCVLCVSLLLCVRAWLVDGSMDTEQRSSIVSVCGPACVPCLVPYHRSMLARSKTCWMGGRIDVRASGL